MADDRPHDHITRRTIVLDITANDEVLVTHGLETPAPGGAILTDVYYPPGAGKDASNGLLPAVVLVAGYPDEGMQRILGCRFKDMGSSTSWARAIAVAGIVAVTYVNRDPAATLDEVLGFLGLEGASLGIDQTRIGLWASSGNVPLALSRCGQSNSRPIRCLAACYGYLMDLDGHTTVADAARQFGFRAPLTGKGIDALPTDVPMFLARAGQDQMPGLNSSMDCFISRALEGNLPVSVVNHPSGPHAFDLLDDSEASRSIIRQVLAFLQRRLDVDLTVPVAPWRPMTADLTTLFLREIDALRREVDLYPTDEAVWQVIPGIPNTGGTLVLHLVGNLRAFIGASIGGTSYVRNRDAEFADRGVTRATLSGMISEARADVEAGLGRLSPQILAATFPVAVGGRSMTTQMFVMHLLSHLAYHLGQIDYHRRAATGDIKSAGTLPLSGLGTAAP